MNIFHYLWRKKSLRRWLMPNIFPCLIYQQDSGIAHRKKDHMSVHIQHTHRETLFFWRLPSQLCLAYVLFTGKQKMLVVYSKLNRKWLSAGEDWRSSCSYRKLESLRKTKKVKTPVLCNENSKHEEKFIWQDLQVDHSKYKEFISTPDPANKEEIQRLLKDWCRKNGAKIKFYII